MKSPPLKDPTIERITTELRALRRGQGSWETRLAPLVWTVDAAGLGMVERAVHALEDLRSTLGQDPESNVGAFFWIGDIGIDQPDHSLEQRLDAYGATFHCDARTALRRSDKGIRTLAAHLRDYSETGRPEGLIWLFQSGTQATVVLDFLVDNQSVRSPVIHVDGALQDTPPFVGHRETQDGLERYRARIVMDDLPLKTNLEPYESCLNVQVTWDMPIWPVWQLTSWIVDPHFVAQMRTHRNRGAEARVVWRKDLDTRKNAPPDLHGQ